MKKTGVIKLAFALKVMVLIIFVCNLIALFFVPTLAALRAGMQAGGKPLLEGESIGYWLGYALAMWNPGCWFMALAMGDKTRYWLVLSLFLLLCGMCTAIILWQAKRVLDTIIKENPFTLNNAGNLKRAAVCCFVISGAALVRTVWSLCYFHSPIFLASYNTLFIPIFLMGGLLFMVMSALFRQAAGLKEENDLTI